MEIQLHFSHELLGLLLGRQGPSSGLPVVLRETEIHVGPCLQPSLSLCMDCLIHPFRRRQPRFDANAIQAAIRPDLQSLAYSIVAGYLSHAGPESLRTRIVRFGLDGKLIGYVPLFRRPHCDCPAPAGPPKGWGYWTNPVSGIVDRLSVTSAPIGGSYHATAVQYQPLPVAAGLRDLLLPGAAYGRGSTQSAAEISCIAEALERYSMVWQGSEPELISSFEALPGPAIHPNQVLQYSPSQYLNRAIPNSLSPEFCLTPLPYSLSEPHPWTLTTSMLDGRQVYQASELCYLWRYTRGERFAFADSNGCAAGPNLEQARYRALLELIERDALAIWWANRLQRPSLAQHLVPDAQQSIEALSQEGICVSLLDLTTDLGVPVVCAVGAQADGTRPFLGAAAASTYPAAAMRAVSELAQTWLWNQADGSAPEFTAWLNRATLQTHGYLRPRETLSRLPGSQPAEECADLVQRLSAAALEAYWLDLTRPEIGLPVCRVIVPGIAHFWKRYGCQRIFNVPLKMGWINEPLPEEQLHPWGCPI